MRTSREARKHADFGWVRRMVRSSSSNAVFARIYAKVLHHLDHLVSDVTHGKHTASSLASGFPVVMLTTTGAKTGRQSTLPVLGIPEGDDLIVIASNFGQRHHPGWYYNLRAHPEAIVAQGGVSRAVRARELRGDERERVWRRALETHPGWTKYERRAANRLIPVLVLSPVT